MFSEARHLKDRINGDAGPENRIDRQLKIIKGLLFGVGLACGAYSGWYVAANGLDFNSPWPPELAAAIASLYLLAMLIGSIALSKVMDEVEKGRAYKASAFAGSIYLIVYPVWFLMWKGGFVAEPLHWALFLLFWASLASATAYYRFR